MLQIKNLSFTASENGTEKHIVKNISFDVNDGETIVVTRAQRRRQIFACKGHYGNSSGKWREDLS